MAESKRHLEPAAFRLFCQGLPQQEIASTLGVSEQWVSRYKKKHDWDERRQIYVRSTQASVDKLRTLLSEYVDQLENLDGDKDADKVIKITSAIEKLEAHFDILGSTLRVSELWVDYANVHDEELLFALQDHLPGFLSYVRKQYKLGG